MADDDTFAHLDELTEKYNDRLDQLQEAHDRGGNRPDLDDEARRLADKRRDEVLRLNRTGVTSEELEAHLDAADRYRHGL